MKRVRTILQMAILVGLAIGLNGCNGCPGPNTGPGTKVRLQGSGSSFVAPMMGVWKDAYGKAKGVEIDYQSTGSGAGQNALLKGEVDFACSDAPFDDKQLKNAEEKGGTVVHIPLCMGGVVPAYNLGVEADIVFSGEVLAGIYQGEITTWDNPKILDLQTPEVKAKIPAGLKITPVVRQDSSGTTFVFTDFLNEVKNGEGAKVWKGGKGKEIKWPSKDVVAANKNDGVADEVKKTKGAVGYVEVYYAKEIAKIKFGSMRNSKGKVVSADDPKTITAAADSLEVPDDLRYSIVNAPGENAYPIAGTVWAIVYTKQTRGNGKELAEFLTWLTSEDGQKLCETKVYARLPEKIVKKIEGKIKQIETK